MTRSRTRRICLVGWGAIGRRVAQLLGERAVPGTELAAIAVRDPGRARDDVPTRARLIRSPDELAGMNLDLVVEAAGRDAVAPWGRAALRAGADFMVSSTSAFCEGDVLAALLDLAQEHGRQVIVPAGALGGIDALAASSVLALDRVEHRIAKPAAAWRGTEAESLIDLDTLAAPVVFFFGSAREAAARFLQNANAAAISGLAGLGLDETLVSLVADPTATRNTHVIEATGAFGSLTVRLENAPLSTNPKSSEMTALNLVRQIENRVRPLAL